MIYTTYYANLRSVPAGAEVYAISNGCPSGVSIPKLWQKDPSVCHRSILAEWLGKRYGLVVKEWRGEM